MSVIVRIGFDDVKEYAGKAITTKVNNKKHKVYFRVICDDFNLSEAIAFAKKDANVVVLDYQGSSDNAEYQALTSEVLGSCHIVHTYQLGDLISDDEVKWVLEQTPDGVTPVIKLQDTFQDMELVWKLCSKYDKIRFCGGELFCLSDCRIGCCGKDVLDKAGIKYNADSYLKNGCGCSLEVVDFEDLEFEISDKPIKERTTGTKTASVSGGGKKTKKLLFANLLQSVESDF